MSKWITSRMMSTTNRKKTNPVTKSLKELYRKHKHQNAIESSTDNQSVIKKAVSIYNASTVFNGKDSSTINAMLKLLVSFNCKQWDHDHIEMIWSDFEMIDRKNTVSCPTMIKCLVLSDDAHKMSKSKRVLQWMIDCNYSLKRYEWNDFSLSISKLIAFCAQRGDLSNIECIEEMIHRMKIKDIFIQTALVNAYGALSEIDAALKVFDSVALEQRDVVITSCILKALIHNDRANEALTVYDEFDALNHEMDDALNVLAIKSCIRLNTNKSFERGKAIHSAIGKTQNIKIDNILIDFYGHFGDLEGAMNVFHGIDDKQKDVISIGTMMKILIDHQRERDALKLYETRCILYDDICHILAVRAYGNLNAFDDGMSVIEREGLESKQDLFIKSAMIDFYGKFEGMECAAKRVFDSIPDSEQNIVTIGAMMEALYSNQRYTECLELFKNMESINDQLIPNEICFVIALKACTEGTNYNLGLRIHDELRESANGGFLQSLSIQIQLINFYGKCGAMKEAECIFKAIEVTEGDKLRSELAVWNAMVQGHSRNGDIESAQRMVERMERTTELRADHKTLSLLLSACSHSGDVDKAMQIWNEWRDDRQRLDCYVVTSLVDCCSRARRWNEALRLIRECRQKDECSDRSCLEQDYFPMFMALFSALIHNEPSHSMIHSLYHEMSSIFGADSKIMIPAAVLLSRVVVQQHTP